MLVVSCGLPTSPRAPACVKQLAPHGTGLRWSVGVCVCVCECVWAQPGLPPNSVGQNKLIRAKPLSQSGQPDVLCSSQRRLALVCCDCFYISWAFELQPSNEVALRIFGETHQERRGLIPLVRPGCVPRVRRVRRVRPPVINGRTTAVCG